MSNDLPDVPSVWQAATAQVADTQVTCWDWSSSLSPLRHDCAGAVDRPLPKHTHTPPPPPPCAPPLVYLQPWGLVQLWGELTVSCALLWGTMRGDSLPLTTCCAAAWVQFQGRLSAASPISPLVLSIQNTHFLHFCNLQLLRCLDWDPGGACWH